MGTSPVAPLPLARLAGVGAVVFLANAALLVLQLVAGRLLAPFVGSSLETWTVVIGVFLAGIALGNGLGGRLADRYPTPRTLAVLLALGALSALWMAAVPPLLDATGAHRPVPLGVRIPLLAVVLCLPAGLTLSLLTPLAIRLGLPDVSHAGRVTGLVFALSTLGCLVGNYLTGFVLIPAFTVNAIVFTAAGALAALAGVTALWRNTATATAPESAATPGVPAAKPVAFRDVRVAYLIVFLASFCGMALELAGFRLLAQAFGVSLYTWTGIIGVMLAGTATGNFLGGVLSDRVSRRAFPQVYLAGTLTGAGGGVVLVLVAAVVVTRGGFDGLPLVGRVIAASFVLFFLPMLLLGMVSPQVIRLTVPDVRHAGAVAGRVYAWSTVGAIAGTFAAGYLLLSTLGVNRTLLAAALVLALASTLLVRPWQELKEPDGTPAGGNLMLYLFSMVLGGVTGGFILTATTDTGVALETNYYTIRVVSSEDDPPEVRTLNLDLLTHSKVDLTDPTYLYYPHEQVQVELLRAARARTPTPNVLVVGGGGYTFPRCAKTLLPETRMDVVEIDPGVTKVAYERLALDPALGVKSFHMDGRQFVAERVPPGTYDLIIQDAVNDLSVPYHLLTREYNEAVKRGLATDGVYLLTVIDSVAHGQLWKAAVNTLKETFPHVELLTTSDTVDLDARHVYVIYAADKPLDVDAVGHAIRAQWRAGRGLSALAGGAVWADPPAAATHRVPTDRLAEYLNAPPRVILTDQYAPVDNLMSDTYRRR